MSMGTDSTDIFRLALRGAYIDPFPWWGLAEGLCGAHIEISVLSVPAYLQQTLQIHDGQPGANYRYDRSLQMQSCNL